MPEYFDLSLLSYKNEEYKYRISSYLAHTYNLYEGENFMEYGNHEIFTNKKVFLGIYEDENVDFLEFCISLPDCIFYQRTFDIQWKPFDEFITSCSIACQEIQFALCSYEMNSYFIWNQRTIDNFDAPFFSQFPIVYVRQKNTQKFMMVHNLKAQNIFRE